MVQCAFKHCKSSANKFKLFSVPKVNPRSINIALKPLQEKRRCAWLKVLNLKDNPQLQKTDLRVCSLHFNLGRPANVHECEDVDWAPSINIGDNIEESNHDVEIAPDVLFVCVPQIEENDTSQHSCRNIEEDKQDNDEITSTELRVHESEKHNDTSEHFSFQSVDFERLLITRRSFGTQTDNWEELQFDSNISSESVVLEEKAGVLYQSAGIQVCDPWNTINRLNDNIKALQSEVARLNELLESTTKLTVQKEIRNIHLNKELSKANDLNRELLLDKPAFTNGNPIENDMKIKFFTALNLNTFNLVLKNLESGLNEIRSTRLNNFQKLILTFMKLRFNCSFKSLTYRFLLVDTHEASSIFYSVILLINHSFQDFIHWPDADCMKLNVPTCFQEIYGDRVAVIIDCFEIITERPNTLKGRNEMFSQYKQNYTIKYLIGITCQGVISFISNGYTGRTSDNAVTESCGILDKLLPGNIVLADRGFTISEMISQRQAELKTPAFKKNPQFHPVEIEDTRRLASVRVHVERLIGQTRIKYKILNGPIPMSMLKTKHKNKSVVNEIVRAACILVNLCDCVVPVDRM